MDNELFIPNSFTNSLSDLNINSGSFKESNHKTKKRKAPLELSPQLSFKKRINYYIHFFDNHSTLFSFTKILIGLIFLTTPTLMIILYPYYSSLIPLRYYMLPFIISVAVSSAFLIIYIMNRIVSSLHGKNTLFYSWNVANVFKTLHIIIISFFVLWILKELETYLIAFPYLGEYIYQTCSTEATADINLNMFLVNIIFAATMWNEQLNCNNNHQAHTFVIEDYTVMSHKDIVNGVVNAVLTLSVVYFVKIVFCKTKNEMFYFIIMPMIIYECVLLKLYYYDVYHFTPQSMFHKAIEVTPIAVVIICAMCLAIKRYIIKVFKQKYKTYLTHKLNWLTLLTLIISFVLVFGSLGILLCVIVYAVMKFDFNTKMDYNVVITIKNGCWLGVSAFLCGNAFMFGHYAMELIFKPNVYEGFRAVLKNPHYIKVSSKRPKLSNKVQL